jgi:hypothetical protein
MIELDNGKSIAACTKAALATVGAHPTDFALAALFGRAAAVALFAVQHNFLPIQVVLTAAVTVTAAVTAAVLAAAAALQHDSSAARELLITI